MPVVWIRKSDIVGSRSVCMDSTTRRQVLASSGLASVVGLTGCSGVFDRGSGEGTTGVQDSDGDGVIDSEDYAPRDPDVQREEQVKGTDSARSEGGAESSSQRVTFDSFEAGDEFEWSVELGSRSRLEFDTESVVGEHSLFFKRDRTDTPTQISRAIDGAAMREFSFWFKYDSENNNNFRVMLKDASNTNIIVVQEGNEATRYWDPERKGGSRKNTRIGRANPNTWYNVVVSGIDFEANTATISVYDSGGGFVNGVEDVGFWESADEISKVTINDGLGRNGNPEPLWIDHMTYKN